MDENNQRPQIQVKASEEKEQPQFCNLAQIAHNREEFVMDLMAMFPPQAVLISRIVMTPGHYKRFVKSLTENLAKYEEVHGRILDESEHIKLPTMPKIEKP